MADTNKIGRPLLRMATAILDSLRQAIVEPQLPVLPQREWERAQQLRRQLLIARQRGWQGAAEELLWDFKGAVRILSRYVDAGCREIDSLPDVSAKPLLNLRQMYDELDALQTEFGEFDCNLKQHTISIVTDPITLEDIGLGPFQIVLHWDRLNQQRSYEVVAIEPYAATTQDDVPHPHVQGQALCEGDGKAAIRSALQQGRLCDFFLLVTQILQTYNAGSAYVRLEQWTGSCCSDCGDTINGDDVCSCNRCGSTTCYECSCGCAKCDDYCCSECRGRCHGCDETHCRGCLSSCSDCGQDFCEECLLDERCQDCRETADETPPVDETLELVLEPAPTPADAAIQPDGVGEAVVPARPRPDRSGWLRDLSGRRLLEDRRRAARATKLHLHDGSLRRCRRRRLLRFAS